MINVRMVHTAGLEDGELEQIRTLLDEAFEGSFTDADWDHTLGGMRAMVHEDGSIVAHGAVVQRRLLYRGRAMRTGYVEGVAVRADKRRHGYAAAVMNELERIIRTAYRLGALSASDRAMGFYLAREWRAWKGPTSVLAPAGITRTPEDDDSTFVLFTDPKARLDVTDALICDWREGDAW